jgi:hypothetical protein
MKAAHRQVDDRLQEPERHHAAELPREHGDPAHGRQREPVQEPGLDVAREICAGVHGREQRALDERHGKRECHERVRREPGQLRLGLEPARVDREQEHREEQRRNHVGGLPQRPHD